MFQLLPQKLQLFEEEKILPTDEEHLERTSPEIRPQPATELGAASASVDSVDTAHCGFRGVAPSSSLQASHLPCTQFLGPFFTKLGDTAKTENFPPSIAS